MVSSNTIVINLKKHELSSDSNLHVFFIADNLVLSELIKNLGSQNQIKKIFESKNFYAKFGETCEVTLYNSDNNFINCLFVGLGKGITKISDAKCLGEKIARSIDSIKVAKASLYISKENMNDDCLEILLRSLYNGEYKFTKYFVEKKDFHKRTLESIDICIDTSENFKSKLNSVLVELEAISLTRDLVTEPSNVLYPEKFVEYCKELSIYGVEIKILSEYEMISEGMNALLAVGQGSKNKPYSVYMKWNGDKSKNFEENFVSIVGKGVTFDSGGINLKTNPTNMKCDMAGAAAVLGTIYALAKNNVKKNVLGAVGLVENMPGGNSFKPDDVIISMSGKSIEIDNTDAEGRLVLSDVLWYIQKYYKAKTIVDLATLTGAISVCLGNQHAGLFSNNDHLAENLITSGKNTLDLLWRLPLTEYYDKLNDSHIADIKNCAREVGSVTAAQFLQRFIMQDVKWAHIDIAGVAYSDKYSQSTSTRRATGFGVALLLDFIQKNG